MNASQTPETTTSQTRTFHNSDYRHAASLLQGMRHVRGNRYEAKDQDSQDRIDGLAYNFCSAFEADAQASPDAGAPFSAEFFMAGTQLPKPHAPSLTDLVPPDDDGDLTASGDDEYPV